MTTYDNELRGVLFANKDRKTEKHPNAKGEATIDGVEYWVAAWTQISKNGAKYQSLKFERKDEQKRQEPKQDTFDPEDEIPF